MSLASVTRALRSAAEELEKIAGDARLTTEIGADRALNAAGAARRAIRDSEKSA